jgi:GDPmannose 4,6-dehydratase
MQRTALITGVLGQDGPYLAQFLLEKGYKVYGLIPRHSNTNFSNADYLGVTNRIDFVTGDMLDEASLHHLIKSLRPDEVYNLAAQSFVGASWDLAKVTTEINALGVLHLLNAIKLYSPTTRFYQAATSEQFGNSKLHEAKDENTPFQPRSPYAVAKLYAYWMTVNFRESYGLYALNGLLFNHESPIRGMEFVTRKISDGVARIKLGLAEEIVLGNLDAKRDWGFAGDFVEAMWLMLQQSEPEDFVVATGAPHSVREFLDLAFRHAGIDDWAGHVKTDPRFMRPAEVHALHGDASKAREKLGWTPKVSFEELVRMMVDADLERLTQKEPAKVWAR